MAVRLGMMRSPFGAMKRSSCWTNGFEEQTIAGKEDGRKSQKKREERPFFSLSSPFIGPMISSCRKIFTVQIRQTCCDIAIERYTECGRSMFRSH